ncbi:MAG: HAMP domain-containing histidine kinase [Bdellovibrionales bacterium]|nr:HAMP domain-containing histidine kinase [Bdellovibrionales bacterium]
MRSLPANEDAPFSEMKNLEAAVNGLHLEIERLQQQAAKEATVSAHFSLLREIGHDLRTPHSQLARNFALLIDTVKTKKHLDVQEVSNVERNLKRMGELIRQVRTLSVSEKRLDNSELTGFHLQKELRTLVEDLRLDPEIIENKIEIDFQSEEIFLPIRMTGLEFYRIVENIVRNAITAVMENPSPKITMRLGLADGRPSLSVADNGSGIAPEIQHRIFDFNFTTKPSRGTGLGLGIVKHICDQHKADINFSSVLKLGTEFKITFSPIVETDVALNENRRTVRG